MLDIDKDRKYDKEDILKSKQFLNVQRDLLSVLLVDKQYSIEECKKILDKECKRKVVK